MEDWTEVICFRSWFHPLLLRYADLFRAWLPDGPTWSVYFNLP